MAVQVVEFFGHARMLAGASSVEVEVPAGTCVAQLLPLLARICPKLRGAVLKEDLSSLEVGYLFSVGGRRFLDDLEQPLDPAEPLLLMPAAAGGAAATNACRGRRRPS